MKPNIKNTNYIDAIKGISIAMIFFTHFRVSENTTYQLVADFGARGVQIFYIIATYLAMESYQRIVERQSVSDGKASTASWIMKKIVRLIPIYWIYVGVVIATGGIKLSLSELFTSLTFLNVFMPERLGLVNGFTMVLVPMYFFVPIIFKKINSLERAIVFSACVIASSYYLNNFTRKIFDIGTEDIHLRQYLFMTVINWGIMSLGVVLYHILRNCKNLQSFEKKELKINKMSVYTVSIALLLMMLSFIKHGDIQSHSAIILFSISFLILILGCKIAPNILVVNRFWSFLGRYTYGIYLFHIVVIGVVSKWINNKYLIFVIAFALATLLAFLLTNYVEKPILRVLATDKK